jgi:hypothetical protein
MFGCCLRPVVLEEAVPSKDVLLNEAPLKPSVAGKPGCNNAKVAAIFV